MTPAHDLRSGPSPAGQPDPGGLRVAAAGQLSPARLSLLVRDIIAADRKWRPAVRFSPERRWFRRLELAGEYEVWLLSWLPGQHTGFHDHGDARGAFGVASGELREALAVPGSSRVRYRSAQPGSVTGFGQQHLHDVGNVTGMPAVSIHAYSPPLTAMRRYEMTAAGLRQVRTDRAELDW